MEIWKHYLSNEASDTPTVSIVNQKNGSESPCDPEMGRLSDENHNCFYHHDGQGHSLEKTISIAITTDDFILTIKQDNSLHPYF